VILAEALLIKNGLIAIPTAATITTIIVDVVFVFIVIFYKFPLIKKHLEILELKIQSRSYSSNVIRI
jgi:hypothetical protein